MADQYDADINDIHERQPMTKWTEKTLAKSAFEIGQEFTANRKYTPPAPILWKTHDKNRYDDIFCADSTRVVLKGRSPEDDYINASWMEMPDKQNYICTQGPITSSLGDFWHMVYTEKSTVILMLTAMQDDEGYALCTRYFPLTPTELFKAGPYTISVKSEKKEPFCGMKHTVLQLAKDNGYTMDVNHFLYDAWNYRQSPETAGPTVGLIKLARKLAGGRPITVHSSAGVGRACTFVGIDYASLKIVESKEHDFEMLEVLRELRAMRFHAILTPLDYIFMHLAVLEMLVQDGTIQREAGFNKFEDCYKRALMKIVEKMKKRKEQNYE